MGVLVQIFTEIMNSQVLLSLLAVVGFVSAGQKCHNGYYNGKKCASTTHYADSHKGACGCGPDNNDNQAYWNHNGFATAPNQRFFDHNGGGWCGETCGRCVRLTTTGGYINGQGGPTNEGLNKVFMVTNLCPNEYPNLSWCSQVPQHTTNQYGYEYHFDLENGVGQIDNMGWNNPEVTWEFVNCDTGHREDGKTPSNGMYHNDCWCGHNGKRSINATTDCLNMS